MAISFVAAVGISAISGANATLTIPGSPIAGDLVVVSYAIGDNDGVDFNMAMVTAGYTEVADLHSEHTQDCDLGVYWKVMPATPDTTAEVDGLGGTDAAVAAVCMVFRGVDNVTPMDVTPTTVTGTSSADADPPSIDHNNPAGVWTVIAAGSAHTLTTGSYTFGASYSTNKVDQWSDDTGSDVTVGMGYSITPADPEDPAALNHSGTDGTAYSWCACTMALRPAVAAAASGVGWYGPSGWY
jgi:hypothetical protein